VRVLDSLDRNTISELLERDEFFWFAPGRFPQRDLLALPPAGRLILGIRRSVT